MATLTKRQKRFIIEHLAVWETPTDVVEAFKEEFGTKTTRQQVHNYNADSPHSRKRMAKDLEAYFDECRERFLERKQDIAIANKAYRLNELGKILRKFNSPKVRMDALEQAAKEVGEAYTNKQKLEHTGKDGGAIEIKGVNFDD